jgi:hypothetical protein
MKPIDQSIPHQPEVGQYGDCMRAMVASLFEVGIETVPHFFEDGCNAQTFNERINAWLRPMNLGYLPIGVISPEHLQLLGIQGLHHELSGQASRGVLHACAALDGVVTHDPHPRKGGLLSIEMSGVFVILDPSKPVRRPE